MAEYERGNKVIKTKDFTDNALVNFEPAFAFMGDNEDYIETLEKLKLICPDTIALISRGYPKNISGKNDLLIRLFDELMEYDSCLKQYIPILTEDIIIDVIKPIGMKVQTKKIVEFIMNRYNMIEKW